MSMVIYNGPIGDPIENPSKKFLKEIILETPSDYWLQGSGDSCLELEESDERLIFFYDEPYGVFIMRHPDYLAPYDSSKEIEVVEHLVGGEPMKIPSCCYVPRVEAYKILLQFIEEKKIPDNINWVDIYDLEFDHGY